MRAIILTSALIFSISAFGSEKVGTLEMGTITDPLEIAMVLYRGDYFINNNVANSPKCLRARFDLAQETNQAPDSDALYRGYLLAGYRVSKIVASKVGDRAVDFSFELTGPDGKVISLGNTICELVK